MNRPTSESLPASVMKCTTGGCKRGGQRTNTIMARGQTASTGRSARSEFTLGGPQARRGDPRFETMPAGSVENIIKQYDRAKAYDGRIKDMSADEIRREVEGIKQFGVITNAQVDAIFAEQKSWKSGLVTDSQTELLKDLKGKQNIFEREKALFARALDYLDQRRTESPYDDVSAASMVLYQASAESDSGEIKEFKSLSKEIAQDAKWLEGNSNIDGVSAEKRAVTKERLSDNQERLQVLEEKSSARLNDLKEVFQRLIGA